MMKVFPIESAADHERALAIIDAAWDSDLSDEEQEAFDALCALVDAWESRHVPFGPGDPIEIIESKLRELRWSQRELTRQLGWSSSGRVSEILNRKRPLTLAMVRDLSRVLGIRAGVLVHDARELGETSRWVCLPPDVARAVAQAAQEAACEVDAFVERALRSAAAGWEDAASCSLVSSVSSSTSTTGGVAVDTSTGTTVTFVDFEKRRVA